MPHIVLTCDCDGAQQVYCNIAIAIFCWSGDLEAAAGDDHTVEALAAAAHRLASADDGVYAERCAKNMIVTKA